MASEQRRTLREGERWWTGPLEGLVLAVVVAAALASQHLTQPAVWRVAAAARVLADFGRLALVNLAVTAPITIALAVVGRVVFARTDVRIAATVGSIVAASLTGVVAARLIAHEPLTAAAVVGQTVRWTVISVGIAIIYYAGFYAEIAANQADAAEQRRAELQRLARRTELERLQRQIAPHFLFNALATAKGLYRDDAARGAALLASLGAYLKSGEGDGVTTTLGRELELTQAYLGVCQARLGDRLTVAIEAPGDLADAELPPLTLATFVENAIIHGLEPKPEGGRLTVRVEAEGERLTIAVEDDGRGLPENATPGTGIGLSNIRSRLASLYGEAAGVEVTNRPTGGVAARLWLPLARVA
jgi:hypothetical protein